MFKEIGLLASSHRVQKGLTQKQHATASQMCRSKLAAIESGKYPSLHVYDLEALFGAIELEFFIRVARRGIILQSRTGTIEHHTHGEASHCSGQGFTIVWQSGALCTHCDRNGATVDDILLVVLERAKEMARKGFTSNKREEAMKHMVRALQLWQGEGGGNG
jgi:transcriptional regulator with XRE-family HTH domain